MEAIANFITYVFDLGPAVTMPIMIILLGLIARLGFTKSFRAGLMYGIGLTGLFAVMDLYMGPLGDALSQAAELHGFRTDLIDVSWTVGAALAFSSKLMPIYYLVVIVIDLLLVSANVLKTVYIDIWNYWVGIAIGEIIFFVTGNFWFAIIAAVVTQFIILFIADWTAKYNEYFGMPKGVVLCGIDGISFAPFSLAINWIIDKIPGIRDVEFSMEDLAKKFGFFGEPAVIGGIMGVFIGVYAGYDLKGILALVITLAATLFLFPRMIGILMMGLVPLADGLKELVAKRFKGKEINLGMDISLGIAHPSVMTVAVLSMPIWIILSQILPGNRWLPVAVLVDVPFYVLWGVGPSKGNLFRSMICATIIGIMICYGSTYVADVATMVLGGSNLGVDIPAGSQLTSVWIGSPGVLPWVAALKAFFIK